MNCRICDADRLESIPSYGALTRITSDLRPWLAGGQLFICRNCGAYQKQISDKELDSIYANYSSERTKDRSKPLITLLQQYLAAGGSMLEIGPGNGYFLKAFTEAFPDWTTTAIHRGEDIPKKHFDLVVMIHTLEHIQKPLELLKNLRFNHILIDVPDVDTSLYDILVADHVLHFSWTTLQRLLLIAGLRIVTATPLLPKELVFLARGGVEADIERIKTAMAQTVISSGAVGVFGTSISGMGIASNCMVDFYVDEDPRQIGRTINGKPVLAPSEVPHGAKVIMPEVHHAS